MATLAKSSTIGKANMNIRHRYTILVFASFLIGQCVLSGCYHDKDIHEAARTGDVATVVDRLVVMDENRVSVDDRDKNGNTPLHDAARFGQIRIAQVLFDNGADVYARNVFGETPIDLAIKTRQKKMVDLLHLKELCVAAEKGNKKTVLRLLNKGVKVDGNIYSGLKVYYDARPIDYAAMGGHSEVVSLLISRGAKVNWHNTQSGSSGYTALMYGERHKDVVNVLIAHGARVDERNNSGETALFHIARSGSKDMLKYFIEKGANVNAKNKYGKTPLHAAVGGHDRLDVLKILISKRANVNAQDSNGNTPLHQIIYADTIKYAELLLKSGANVNAKNKEEMTPLLLAISLGKTDLAELLIRRGANVNARDESGRTPLHLAESAGLTQLERTLKKHGAQ